MDTIEWYYFKQRVAQPFWWLRHRLIPKYKYHVIYTGLNPGYHDCDTRIFYGIFKAFEEFMEFQFSDQSHVKHSFTEEEIELECEWVEPEHKEEHKQWFYHRNEIWEELCAIYDWWKLYPYKEKAIWEEPISKEALEEEDALYEEANEVMCRLIQLRKYLWD